MGAPIRLQMQSLAAWERDGLRAALRRAKLPADDIGEPHVLCWRFETYNDVPAGFGGLEIHGSNALIRSVVTIPPVRRIGMGRAIVAALEAEAAAHNCRAVYLLTATEAGFFRRLGYAACERTKVPAAIRATAQFSALRPASATAMVKRIRWSGISA